MISNKKEVSAQYRAEKAAFNANRRPTKLRLKAKKRVDALNELEDRNMLKRLGLL